MIDGLLSELKRSGSEEAFNELYRQTSRPVFNVVLSVVRNYHTAEELTQEVFMSVLKNAAAYREGTNAKAWIYTIAKNTALNRVKKDARVTLTDAAEKPALFGVCGSPEDSVCTPVTDTALRCLSGEEFEIVMLCDVCGYKRREVAKMIGQPLSTVTWRRNKALKTLEAQLRRGGQYE